MKSIILVDSKHILVNYLDKFNITKEKIVFLHWNDDDDISLMLKNRCCDEVERVVLDKNEFIKEYTNLIAHAARKLNSRHWWATDIASNDQTCPPIVVPG